MSRCSHVENGIQCSESAIELYRYKAMVFGKMRANTITSEYCFEHHAEYYFSPSETLSTYCAECPEDAEPMIVMNKRLELLHRMEEGFSGDPKGDSHISSDHGFTSWGETCCPKHGGSKDQWAKYASRKSITFVRSDCR